MLTNLTASVRFDGALNTDLSDITSNLVPFPRLHFLVPALAPLYATRDLRYRPAAGRKEPPGPARGQRRPMVAPKAQAAPRDSPAAPEQLGSSRSPPELSPRPLPTGSEREAPSCPPSGPARLEHMFSDAFAAHSQLLRADPRHSRYLACGLLLRGSWLHARPGLGGDSALSAVLAAPRAQAAPAQPGAQPAKLGRSPWPPELATACSQD